ncbi:transmembrane protein, putative (macronuclear) [Tetrahymena thermophila SB210]|uniref:Transmembrane protein, putative n=1 Tax=Tetrahymena thermophila (strain SB210) TaxID=312017 RepID=W7XIZ1_TETTS|nr:transmembrane protein, putative [Tetrahymena thermophila SB210]EWS75046.1 transmembrane protein, putative [Tetrahymena thermophila SB210]|eukprot:XP_012652421.1 transmembrane protein, putative [Tetrahymena thermophila SB210]
MLRKNRKKQNIAVCCFVYYYCYQYCNLIYCLFFFVWVFFYILIYYYFQNSSIKKFIQTLLYIPVMLFPFHVKSNIFKINQCKSLFDGQTNHLSISLTLSRLFVLFCFIDCLFVCLFIYFACFISHLIKIYSISSQYQYLIFNLV